MPSSGLLSYCDLFNMPAKPYPAIEPKPYLGVYLTYKKIEEAIQPCKENLFIQVAGVINGTAAAKMGLQNDDVILSINGNPTCKDAEQIVPAFKKIIEQQRIGAPVTLEVLRKDQKVSLTATLDEMPMHEQPEARHPGMNTCPEQSSMFEDGLRAQNALPLYDKIISEMHRKSNLVHNPGSVYKKGPDPLQLNEVTYLMRHPLAAGEVSKGLSERVNTPLDEDNWRLGDVMQRTASLLDIDYAVYQRPPEISFPSLLKVMEETKNTIEEAFSNLTAEERVLLQNDALKLTDGSQWNKIFEISMKVDRTKLFNAFSPLLFFLTRDNLLLLREDIVSRFGNNKGSVLYEAMTPIGKVIVGGTGPNAYSEDAALILDLGGDDLYLNNAGGTRHGMPVSLLIDWGGNDRYMSKDNFSQGSGVLGGGFLIDLGGDDTFISLDGSQGTGSFGVGFLYHGNGKGVFNARKLSQGTGQMGIGIMINQKSDDTYSCSYGGQGLGLFGGAGILIDEAGNDVYQLGGLEPDFRDPAKATQSLGQGFGLGIRPEKDINGVPGGIGMLIDKEGADTYIADYFAQGASYYYGLGILDDRAGNDQYVSGRYSQGAGVHSSVGVLIDRRGNDFYYSSFGVAQAMGHDFGVGFLYDEEGDNRYYGGTLVQGAATNGSIGILIDLKGTGQFTSLSQGQAYALEENSMGILINKGRATAAPGVKLGIKKE